MQTDLHEKPSVYFETDSATNQERTIIRASAIGSCHLKLALIANGRVDEVSRAVRQAWKDGHVWERWIKTRLRDAGLVIEREQEVIEIHGLPGCLIRGHWDGFCPNVSTLVNSLEFSFGSNIMDNLPIPYAPMPAVFEAKSANGDHFDEFVCHGISAFPNYGMQLSSYMHWARAQYHNPKIGALVAFQSKDDLMALAVRYYPEPPFTLQEVQSKQILILSSIYQLRGGGPIPQCHNHKQEVFSCSFHDHHADDESEVVLENPPLKPIDKLADQDLVTLQSEFQTVAQIADEFDRMRKEQDGLVDRQQKLRQLLSLQLTLNQATLIKTPCGYGGEHKIRMQAGRSYTAHEQIKRDFPDYAQICEEYKRDGKPFLVVNSPRKKK